MHAEVHVPVLSYEDVIELWRSDAMAKRSIELLPASCFARGYELTVKTGEIDLDFMMDVQDRMDELKVDELVERCYRYERGFGGGAILMGVDDGGAIDEPLVPAKIRFFDWLTVLEPLEIYPASYYQDPSHPKYGEPEYYRQQAFTVSGAGTVIGVTDRRAPAPTNQLIHESRLIVFGGQRVSRYQRNNSLMGPLWGDSVLISIIEALRDYNIAWSAAALLGVDFAQSVVSVENLMAQVARNADGLRARMQAMDMMRSNARMIMIDSKEKFQRESTSVNGLPELLDRISQRMAADADIPLSMLLGVSQSGLGQPGQNDVAMFQDRVRSAQRRRLTPVIQFLANVIMKTLRKYKMPERWGVKWGNLVHQSDKDIAEERLTIARSDSMYVKMGAIRADEVRDSRWRRGYSMETQVTDMPAPGFIAPLPAGVLPKAEPAEAAIRTLEADAEQKAEALQVGPDVHVVGGYARRNPTKPAFENTGDGGGDLAPRRDADGPGQHKVFAGIPVVVESPKGSLRHWVDTDGRRGSTKMRYDYGYVPGVNGTDGDSVDVYLGPHEDASNVYVMHQMRAPEYLHHDEDKAMLGFRSKEHARDTYLMHRNDDRALGGITPYTLEQFRTAYLGSGLASLHTLANSDSATAVVPAFTTPGDIAELETHLDRVVQNGAEWKVLSQDGSKSLGVFKTKSEALKRLKQISPNTPGDEMIYGGWMETGEGSYELDKPAGKEPTDNPLWNQPLKSGGDEEA